MDSQVLFSFQDENGASSEAKRDDVNLERFVTASAGSVLCGSLYGALSVGRNQTPGHIQGDVYTHQHRVSCSTCTVVSVLLILAFLSFLSYGAWKVYCSRWKCVLPSNVPEPVSAVAAEVSAEDFTVIALLNTSHIA